VVLLAFQGSGATCRALENLHVSLDNVQARAAVAVGILIGAHSSITIDVDERTLGQVQHKVTAGAGLGEGGDAEPAGLAVAAGATVAGDGVANDFATSRGLMKLRSIGEVTDDGDSGDVARGGGAEGAGSVGRDTGSTAEEERRHVLRLEERSPISVGDGLRCAEMAILLLVEVWWLFEGQIA
jgi:hypothetical protein